MKKICLYTIILFFGILFSNGSHSQEGSEQLLKDRPMSAAGGFYPSDPAELRSLLSDLFAHAKPRIKERVRAIVCPHAGYIFSGIVAATSVNQIPENQHFENIFIIGSSHTVSFKGASVYTAGDYLTPLGKVKVNRDLASKLIKENPLFTYYPAAEQGEHCVEVEVPFLQFHLKKAFTIVPIILGTQSEETCKQIALALKPYFNEKNLFVFSTDFSHYPSYNDAMIADKRTCDAILSDAPANLLRIIHSDEKSQVPGLVTSLCGWTSILTMLDLTSENPSLELTSLQYKNSGDSKYPDKSRVVGYWSIVVSEKVSDKANPGEFSFSSDEKKALLKIARNTITQVVSGKAKPAVDPSDLDEKLKVHAGVFVTLTENKNLRGCIGQFISDKPLYELVQEMAIASATQDTRFEPVNAKEVSRLVVEISVLSPLRRIHSPNEIILGKHGIYIKKGYNTGTFLPQVADGTGWTREEFLGHCARDKAGIGWDGWKDAELFVYEATVFSEREFSSRKDP
jgi:MEMO1 family protein